MIVNDIEVTEDFLIDYESGPQKVKDRIDVLTGMILVGGRLPKSMNPHKSPESETWIGYVTVNKGSWRVLFQENLRKPGTIIYLRLIDHNTMDMILK